MTLNSTSPPLADYFWIAGIDSVSYGETPKGAGSQTPLRGSMIREDLAEAREAELNGPPSNASPRSSALPSALMSKKSAERLSSFRNNSPSPRVSAQVNGGENIENALASLAIEPSNANNDPKRSSQSSTATITLSNYQDNNKSQSTTPKTSELLSLADFDFDKALRKFAAERENFLDDLSFNGNNAPTPPPKRPPVVNPRVQKVAEDGSSPSIARSVSGSLRRRISLRDMNSMRRAPSVVGRAASIRTAKRLSNYNSVIQIPEPLQPDPAMHPLKRKFEPVLLDRYPPRNSEAVENRVAFPDYVPMFAFPDDVNIVSSDERPRSTWHAFCMTGADNARLYAICLITWLPLNPKAAEEVERRCEEWRNHNMTPEERELASSLGERLAQERVKLSRLLSKLPSVAADSRARESLDEEINATEEKIGLMADLLRPVRHAAASKIEGLTDSDSGLWLPRAFGVIGRDASLTSFYKEWLKAVVVPMTGGAVQRVPLSSPKVGMWQPLERYVVNLCEEAPSPVTSKTQIEVAVRELRLFARREAINELPGSRNVDLYPLFRCLSLENIVTMFEYCLTESRIILLSKHTSMLSLASHALISLLYPLTWAGIFIPVLPSRLLSAIEAPCPYIVGVERRYGKLEFPEDDCVVCDLDENNILSYAPPLRLPKQQRKKLLGLLQLAAPHHVRYGVEYGPPRYVVETFPNESFVAENPTIFSASPPPTALARLVSLPSNGFGENATPELFPMPPIFNAFMHVKPQIKAVNDHRPTTSGTLKSGTPPSPNSPKSAAFGGLARNDSGYGLTATLRGKRSANFDNYAQRRSSSFGMDRQVPNLRRPSAPFTNHSPSPSTSSLVETGSTYNQYPPSLYSPSTLAASTIAPQMYLPPVRDSATIKWIEGHCMNWKPNDYDSVCSICEEKSDEGVYRCANCHMSSHERCVGDVLLPCPNAFFPEQVRAAFVRCFSSLLYTYRRFLQPATGDQKKGGKIFKFNFDGFLKSLPQDAAEYINSLNDTQAFNEFVQERETWKPSDPQAKLFDHIILSKKNRGKTAFFSKSKDVSYLQDASEHLWRTCSAVLPLNTRIPSEQRAPSSRIPSKLDPGLMKEPRVRQGVPTNASSKPTRKPIRGTQSTNGIAAAQFI